MTPVGTHPELWGRVLDRAAGRPAAAPTFEADGEAACVFWRLYADVAAPDQRPFVIGQLGQSLDGRIATPSGHSHYVNGPEAITHLHRLRALVDGVLVGVGTAVADDPRLTVRHVPGRSPARIVIDPRGRLPEDAALLADDGCRVIVVQCANIRRPPRVEPVTIAERGGQIAPRDVVQALAARGVHRLLVEGGAQTVSAFLAAEALDRLHICVAPILIGSGPTGITLPPIERLNAALRPEAAVIRLGRDVLFDCDLRG